ncbi:hypothetical protein BDB00DRAFT_838198 [Zychaea mexicana]|uniref:uncharacterized protein n=1 Tax=Zychaea mexicana TaxID=64656 RepID=UPI0022FE8A23|nr:uncharacterized protein BDB00DRAFT_838198 [Zychaea mexicana]KAI9490373.1 hypothetical protein BDB00DRAFT_838198 [Zychaea mexicana]
MLASIPVAFVSLLLALLQAGSSVTADDRRQQQFPFLSVGNQENDDGGSVLCDQTTAQQHPNSLLHPFTSEWVHVLEQFYNALGGHANASYKGHDCPVSLPTFDCEAFYWNDYAYIPSRDAQHLRPHDIKSVIALGDSITAGFGMLSGRPPFATVWEYRGKVFSAGTDPDEYTIPNFLSIYSNAAGGPDGVTFPMSRGKDLDNAISGAKTQDLDGEVTRLVHLLSSNNHHYQRIKDEWKLITLFIGANNICVLCDPPMTRLPLLAQADAFEDDIRQALGRLKKEVSKSFVNLVALFNVSSVYEAAQGDPYCEFVWNKAHMTICSCVQNDEAQRRAADDMVAEYNKRLHKLASDEALSDKHFQVVYQPGFTTLPIAKYKQGYLSGIDW